MRLRVGYRKLASAGNSLLLLAAVLSIQPSPNRAEHDVCSESTSSSARVISGADVTDPNDPTISQVRDAQQLYRDRLTSLGYQRMPRALPPGSVVVNVHFHVITAKNGSGNVSDSRIAQQMAVLNRSYSGNTGFVSWPTPFRFRVASVDQTANDDWYDWSASRQDPGGSDDISAKAALHIGGRNDLNIYTTGRIKGLLGYATFPWENKRTLFRDGVVVLNRTLPGGTIYPNNLGDTATHEVGHWLGLFHTFQNGCKRPGDLVGDTPYQANGPNKYKCKRLLDSCPAQPFFDPVHNFMSYGSDLCTSEFTAGQARRMSGQWRAFRDAPAGREAASISRQP